MNIFVWEWSHVLGKKYTLHNHSSFDYPFSRPTNFIHSTQLFKIYLLSFFWTGAKHGAGHREMTKRRIPALPVPILRAENISVIFPAFKDLKQSFVLSFTNSTRKLRIYYTSASTCLWLWLARSQNKEFVQRTWNRQAELTCTFSWTHKVPHSNFFLPLHNLQWAQEGLIEWPSIMQHKRKGKWMKNQTCHTMSTRHPFHSTAEINTWHFSYIQYMINMMVVVIFQLRIFIRCFVCIKCFEIQQKAHMTLLLACFHTSKNLHSKVTASVGSAPLRSLHLCLP